VATLRPMTDADVPDAAAAWEDAFRSMRTTFGLPVPHATEEDRLRLERRMCHFLATDPAGSWVADDAGVIAGLSQSFVREGYWVLSMLATVPGAQRRGLGRQLLRHAMDNAGAGSPGSIQCSRHPAAMALYTSAGFTLHPVVTGRGTVRPGTVHVDPWVRHGDEADADTVAAIDRVVRGAARSVDIVAMLHEPGSRLLLVGDRGYAVVRDDRVVTLGALDDDAATALLAAALSESDRDRGVEVNWLTAGQQWAIHTLVDAGVELHPSGPVMVRGRPGPPPRYIPSGGYG